MAIRFFRPLLALGLSLAAAVGQSNFSWSLSDPGLVSAGIYGSDGRLVRVLWTMKELPAGSYQSNWDGLNDDGIAAPAGAYEWKLVVNRNLYTNIGTIGNTGKPSNSFGHVPFLIEGVAVDAQNKIYTVHDWNEAGQDVKRWAPETGLAEFNTGHLIGDALLKAIAVEPDGSRAYVTGYGGADVNDRANIKFSIFCINLGQVAVEDFTAAGSRITVYSGQAEYPTGATDEDKAVMKVPLVSIALHEGSLYVSDALAGRVLKYNKVTGAQEQEISGVPVACGLAVAADGRIWVGHEHSKVSVYDAAGTLLATPITDLVEVRALAIQGSTLCVADASGAVRKYQINGTEVSLIAGFGQAAEPGENRPDRLREIHGMAMDAEGGVIVSDRMGPGSRLQKLDAQFAPLWQQMGLEFSSQAAYSRENPDILISSYRNIYRLDRTTGEWTFLGPGGTDTPGKYFGNYESTHFGPPRVVRFNGEDFFYYPAGDSLAVYRVTPSQEAERGPTLRLAACLGGSLPSPDGVSREQWWLPENKYLWSWDDTQGDGEIQYTSVSDPGEVTLDASPNNPAEWKWDKASFGVDDAGWVWLASYAHLMPPGPFEAKAIYAIAPQGPNVMGNPVYRWGNAVKVMDEATGRNALGMTEGEFNWMMVNRSDDGMVYSLAYADKPDLPQDGSRWMGGNVLFGFEGQTGSAPAALGQPKWHVVLPERSVGMSPIPGGAGGVFVGIGPTKRGMIGHYTKDGLLVGSFQVAPQYGDDDPPNLASGAFDSFMAVNCNRDPRDGVLDVFAEDNWNQRLMWYRVDDSRMETSTGALATTGTAGSRQNLTVTNGLGDGDYPVGTVVNIAAVTPPPGKEFAGWTGDTTMVANAASPNTTVTMPNADVALTATYDWAQGDDVVRFHPLDGSEHRLLNCVFEGSNGDPVNGPYTTFYVVPEIPPAGWTEVSVDMGNFRYVRFRDPETNGMIAEVEFYRDGQKLTGAGFGTPGSWGNEPQHTFEAALDGDTATFFNGPEGKNAYVGVDALGVSPAAKTLTVNSGSGSGRYDAGTIVPVTADAAAAGSEFLAWTGDIEILSNPFTAVTSATMPSMDVSVTATYGVQAVAPVLNRAYLRKLHGGTNTVDLDVQGSAATSNVEGRLGDTGNGHTVILEFDQNVSVGLVTVASGTATVSSMQFSGSTAVVALTGVANRQKVTLELSNFANGSGPAMAAVSLPIRFLIGDANRDGIVNAVDITVTRDAFGTTYGQTGFKAEGDIKTDSIINAVDITYQRDNFGYVVNP